MPFLKCQVLFSLKNNKKKNRSSNLLQFCWCFKGEGHTFFFLKFMMTLYYLSMSKLEFKNMYGIYVYIPLKMISFKH